MLSIKEVFNPIQRHRAAVGDMGIGGDPSLVAPASYFYRVSHYSALQLTQKGSAALKTITINFCNKPWARRSLLLLV